MDDHRERSAGLTDFIYGRFIWFVVGFYALAAVFPAPGLWIRRVSFGHAG
jgi:hypothetical protein